MARNLFLFVVIKGRCQIVFCCMIGWSLRMNVWVLYGMDV